MLRGIGGGGGALSSNTFTADGAASTPPVSLTGTWFSGGSATTTKPHFLIEPTGTTSTAWSTSGTGIGANAATGFVGNLLDLQLVAARKFAVDYRGRMTLGGGLVVENDTATDTITIRNSGSQTTTLKAIGSDARTASFAFNSNAIQGNGRWESLQDGPADHFTAKSANAATTYFSLCSDAANVLAQRNSTNAQTFRVYNTYTDASNYERATLSWASNVAYLKAENAGTGSARLMVPVTGSTTVAGLPSASTAGAGARSFVTDANATTFASTVAGGGANKVPVVSDGTNWLIG